MQITPATFPPHVARAYGVRTAPPVAPAVRTAPSEGADAIAKIAPAQPKATGEVNRLVASVVPGSISFTEDGTAMPKAPALPIYAHPADRNAAATGIALGSSIDVSG
jgi:hypothetical protein